MKFARIFATSVVWVMLLAGVSSGASRADFEAALAKAKRGNAEAQFEVALMYYHGDGVKQDYKKAREYFEKAAAQNNGNALVLLGGMYNLGAGVKQDDKKAREYYEKAAAQNNGYALGFLGLMYSNGTGVKQDKKKGREYLEKAAALQNGNGMGLIGLAMMYLYGLGVKENYNKGIKYLEAYLDQDIEKYSILDTVGTDDSTSLYEYALKTFIVAVYEKASTKGKDDIQLGEKNKILKYLKKGADLSITKYLRLLGTVYEEGSEERSDVFQFLSVGRNYHEALKYYTKGAELGDEDCMMSLGRFYENGLGVKKDMNKAVDFYQQATANGSEQAKKALARLNVPPKTPAQHTASVPASGTKPQKQPVSSPLNNIGANSANDFFLNKPRVAIYTFVDKSEEHNAPADAIINMMVTELHKANVFRLVERERLDTIIAEHNLNQSGMVNPAEAIKAGRIAGAQYIMTGSITLYYYSEKASGFAFPVIGSSTKAKTAYVVLDLRIYDAETSDILYASAQTGEATQTAKTSPGNRSKMVGGLLSLAIRDSVLKHVSAIKAKTWEI